MEENSIAESNSKKAFENDLQNSLNTVLTSDEIRRAAFQFSHEEQQQNVTVYVY